MESQTSPTSNNSSTPSPISLSKYLEGLNLIEEPLVGLLEKPLEKYNHDEIRAFVQEQRALRESRQSFKAAVVAQQSGAKKEKKETLTNKLFNEF